MEIERIKTVIVDIIELQKLLEKSVSEGTINRWQFEKQSNVLCTHLDSISTSLSIRETRFNDICNHVDNKEQTENYIDTGYYNIGVDNKDKRVRNILKLIDNVHINLLKIMLSIKHDFDFLPKEQKKVLSKEIIDNIMESFDINIKKYVNKLKKIGISEKQIEEFNIRAEKYLLHIMDIYIELYKKDNENKPIISLKKDRYNDIKRIRKCIEDRKKQRFK